MMLSAADLKKAILEMESKRMKQEDALKMQLNKTYQSMRPVNLIKDTWNGFTRNSFNQNPWLKAFVGIGVIFATRKLTINKLSRSVFTRLARGVLELGFIKAAATGRQLLKNIGRR